ncbi:MAG: hypothetical protein ABIH08_00735 [Candidatus Omnitrophota bacterium]
MNSFSKLEKAKTKSAKENKKDLLGLSVLDFSGFHICQIYDKKALTDSLAQYQTSKKNNLS